MPITIIRPASNVKHTVLIVISIRGKALLFLLSNASSFSMKMTMDTSIIDGTLVRMKSDFTSVMFVNLNSDNNIKLKNGLARFMNGSN